MFAIFPVNFQSLSFNFSFLKLSSSIERSALTSAILFFISPCQPETIVESLLIIILEHVPASMTSANSTFFHSSSQTIVASISVAKSRIISF
jgi:hypothetical protein